MSDTSPYVNRLSNCFESLVLVTEVLTYIPLSRCLHRKKQTPEVVRTEKYFRFNYLLPDIISVDTPMFYTRNYI